MAESDDVVVERPNREKASSKALRAIVVLLLLASAALVLIITLGGWSALEGAKLMQLAYVAIYLLLAVFVLRWNRGVLPLIAALAMILLIFAAVSTPSWFDRDKFGFTSPALPESVVGLLTALLVPLQLVLIGFAMAAFRQAWNVEVERPREERDRPQRGGPEPAAA